MLNARTKAATFEAMVVGSSAGGIKALGTLLTALPADFSLPILITQHLHPDSDSYLADILNDKCAITVKQADEKEDILPGNAYIAPPPITTFWSKKTAPSHSILIHG